MSIRFDEEKSIFSLETTNSLYQMKVAECGFLLHLYYGRRTGSSSGDWILNEDTGWRDRIFPRQGRR